MSLSGCVASLAASCNLLQGSLATLEQGISDFPRLIHVLQNTRHFEILPESTVIEAQEDLRDEIIPQREELISRAQKALNQLERKEYSLKSKKELQEVRLQQRPLKPRMTPRTTAETANSAENAKRVESLRLLKSKKERLAYSLKRLQMEEQGRKTRMSLAPGAFSGYSQ